MSTRPKPIHVLVVDDSALVRQVASAILSQEPGIEVTAAADPFIAIEKMARQRPDVILLDLELPRMHGLTFLHKIMSEDPIPVVVCSGTVASGDAIALAALEQGAVSIITKPKLGVREFLHESAMLLIDTVIGAAQARVAQKTRSFSSATPPARVLPKPRFVPSSQSWDKVVVIGASTGGPQVIGEILQQLTPDCPGIVIVQHMPEAFTGAYAQRLNTICEIDVKEAQQGDSIRRGRALIAPGNRHVVITRSPDGYITSVVDGPLVNRHRPSVDVTFRSAAKVLGRNAMGIILTGMGNDGAQGMMEMKQSGAFTIAQDEASSVVFGMPKEAIALGAVDRTVSPPQVAAAIASWSYGAAYQQ